MADVFLQSRLQNDELVEFARSLVSGVRRNQGELDGLLTRTADNWSLGRMAATDRNVLRLGAYEILYTATPGRVAINEAVELAKRYGSAHSAPVRQRHSRSVPRRAPRTLTPLRPQRENAARAAIQTGDFLHDGFTRSLQEEG